MPPAEPIRLMTALALERRGFRVTSGIRATAGDRNTAMDTSTIKSSTMKNTRVTGLLAVASQAQAWRAGTT